MADIPSHRQFLGLTKPSHLFPPSRDAQDVDELPGHVRPVELVGVRTKPLRVGGSQPVARSDPLWVAQAPRSPSGSWLRVPGKAMEVEAKSIVFAPDPMVGAGTL